MIFRIKFLSLLTLGCTRSNIGNRKIIDPEVKYDIRVDYEDNLQSNFNEFFDNQISSDSLYLFFETGFNENIVTVHLNGRIQEDTITTNSIVGLAEVYVLEYFNDSNSFSIQVDRGEVMQVQPQNRQNVWLINYYKDSLLVAYSEHAPFDD